MGTPWWNMPSRGILGSMICKTSRGGLRGEQGPQEPVCREWTWVSEAPITGSTHQRWVGGVAPALSPHQVQGIQGRILILRQPPCASPHALTHHCTEERAVSCVTPGDGASQAHSCAATLLTAMPHTSSCAHGVGLVLCP